MIEIINETHEVKIRRARYCLFCHRDYAAGSKMLNQVNKFDGRIASLYWCPTCESLTSKYYDAFRDMDYDGILEYTVAEYADIHKTTPEGLLEMLDNGKLVIYHGSIELKENVK